MKNDGVTINFVVFVFVLSTCTRQEVNSLKVMFVHYRNDKDRHFLKEIITLVNIRVVICNLVEYH